MAKYDRNLYCKLMAQGLHYKDAMREAGYNMDNPDSIRKTKANLDKNTKVQAEIKRLKEYYAENPERLTPEAQKAQQQQMTAIEYLRSVYNNPEEETKYRVQAANIVAQFEQPKMAPKGKKEDAIDTAKNKSETGRFATMSHQADMFEGGTIQ